MTSAGHRESPPPLKLCTGEHQALAGNFPLLLTWGLHRPCGRRPGGSEALKALFILIMMIIPNEFVWNWLPPQTTHNTTNLLTIDEVCLSLRLNHFPGENRGAHFTTQDNGRGTVGKRNRLESSEEEHFPASFKSPTLPPKTEFYSSPAWVLHPSAILWPHTKAAAITAWENQNPL